MNDEKYSGTILKNEFRVKKIYTIHYFEYTKDFVFSGEKHDFWEMVYADKGEVNIYAGEKKLGLTRGECFFHAPYEWHNVKANRETAPNLIVISFECNSTSLFLFSGKIIRLTNDEKRILGNIIKEAKNAFCEPLGDPMTKKLVRRKNAGADFEQMVELLLEQLLISIKRNNFASEKKHSLLKDRFDDDIIASVLEYLDMNTDKKLKFKDVTDYAKISSTALKTLFAQKMGCGVMDYFATLKTECAKRLIREENYNFTEISRLLGYDSLHYFSRQFKKKTGMSPTEYANSVRIVIEK